MSDIGNLFQKMSEIFDTPLTIWGFTFTPWQMIMFSAIAGIALWALGELWQGD